MPCYTTRTYEVEAGRMALDVLAKGLSGIGWKAAVESDGVRFLTTEGREGFYHAASGRLRLPDGTTVAQVKVAYARAAVNVAAQRMGWRVAATAQTNKLVMTRRQS